MNVLNMSLSVTYKVLTTTNQHTNLYELIFTPLAILTPHLLSTISCHRV